MRIKHGNYQIILKPAVVIVVASLLGYLVHSFLAAGSSAFMLSAQAGRSVTHPMENPSFEPPFRAVPGTVPHQVATVTGMVSNSWEDRSRWNDVIVDYAEGESPHGGAGCQKITVRQVNRGSVMFCQGIHTEPGHTYEASVWLKSDAPTTVTWGLRRIRQTSYVQSTDVQVTSTWKRVVIRTPVNDPLVYAMLEVKSPATLYVDDADLGPVSE